MSSRDAAVTQRITGWFQRAARPLPWRVGRNGYSALVSEAMLQQTQVARVLEKYAAFMDRFPTVQALAQADEQEVLAAWQGLGYYRRARNLHAAAKMIVREFGSVIPRDVAALQRLPGVGRYTAGAIASIVYGEAEPIVDGNVQRVLARLEGQQAPAGELPRWTWGRAQELVQAAADPGAFNEGLMELGATVCSPRNAACGDCPLMDLCQARRRGLTESVPNPARPVRRTVSVCHAVVISRAGKVLLEQRPARGVWASMWQPPTLERSRQISIKALAERLPISVRGLTRRGQFVHLLSHRELRFHVFHGTSRARRGVWRDVNDTAELPISAAHRRALSMATAAMTCRSS